MANRTIAPLIKAMEKSLDLQKLLYLRRTEGTRYISNQIISTCKQLRFRYIPEYPAGKINGRYSFIDFVCSQRQGLGKTFCVAIEIDSTNKVLSLEKLKEMHSRGFQCVWIRWNTDKHIDPPEGIFLIDLTAP